MPQTPDRGDGLAQGSDSEVDRGRIEPEMFNGSSTAPTKYTERVCLVG